MTGNGDWQRQRTMTGKQFKSVIADLYMTQAGAGRYLGVSERTVRRYAANMTEIPVASILLLRSLVAHNVVPLVPKWKGGTN
jgi:hypothetical protein